VCFSLMCRMHFTDPELTVSGWVLPSLLSILP
jgi:hypothetical protein